MTDGYSGQNVDIFGEPAESAQRPLLVPTPGQRRNGCPLQAEGVCPPDCLHCEEFLAEWGYEDWPGAGRP